MDANERLEEKGIRPTTQRLAVAEFVLNTESHPSADIILSTVRKKFPAISRATIYNVLDLFVRKGLLQKRLLRAGTIVFDPFVGPHHHFIDEKSGAIIDIPLNACKLKKTTLLRDYEITDYHIVMRGRRRKIRQS